MIRTTIVTGLLALTLILLLTLMGVFESFAGRDLIAGLLSVNLALLVVFVTGTGYWAAWRDGAKSIPLALAQGGGAGLIVGIGLLALELFERQIDLHFVFPNFDRPLVTTLDIGVAPVTGLFLIILIATFGGWLAHTMPNRRSIVLTALLLTLLFSFVGERLRTMLALVDALTVLAVVLSGALLLYKELSRKTIYNILSRAIPRWNFLFGKYLGMLLTATLMLLLMGGGFSLFLLLFESAFDPSLFLAYYAIFLELVIICAAAIFFSSVVVTPMLIGLFTAGIFLAGRSAGFLLYFLSNDTLSAPVRYLLQVLYFVLPHLDMLNVSDAIVYGSLVPAEQIVYGTLYAFGYAGVLLFLSHFLFERRDFS